MKTITMPLSEYEEMVERDKEVRARANNYGSTQHMLYHLIGDLIEQVEKNDLTDSLGHKAENLKAFSDLKDAHFVMGGMATNGRKSLEEAIRDKNKVTIEQRMLEKAHEPNVTINWHMNVEGTPSNKEIAKQLIEEIKAKIENGSFD